MKYKVIKKNTLDHKIGDIIELSDKRARDLAGKVELFIEPAKTKARRSKKVEA